MKEGYLEWKDDLLTYYKSRKRKDIFFVFVEWCEKAMHDYTFPSWHIVYIPVERRDTDLLKKRKQKATITGLIRIIMREKAKS